MRFHSAHVHIRLDMFTRPTTERVAAVAPELPAARLAFRNEDTIQMDYAPRAARA